MKRLQLMSFCFIISFCSYVGIPRLEKVTIQNRDTKNNIRLLSISGSTSHFYCSFFHDKVSMNLPTKNAQSSSAKISAFRPSIHCAWGPTMFVIDCVAPLHSYQVICRFVSSVSSVKYLLIYVRAQCIHMYYRFFHVSWRNASKVRRQ